jgi:transposase
MRVTDQQVIKLRQETSMGQEIGRAALRAGMHRNTATKYLATTELPSERVQPRRWRTREDPLEEIWPAALVVLEDAPEVEAKALFEHVTAGKEGSNDAGQLRTFQRRVKEWRAREGPSKELFFPQVHQPGEAIQTDFTATKELGITIAGEPWPHLLCHTVLPYSDWSWATPCRSESMAALEGGIQTALARLGKAPEYCQTDNSTAATHRVTAGDREFNEEYEAFVAHFGMKPRKIGVAEPHENGDVEAHNGALKRCLEQHLLLRGSRDFADREAYRTWLTEILLRRNRLRERRLAEELAVMHPLPAQMLPTHSVHDMRVGPSGTIRVKDHTYSVPGRLAGERVRVHLFEDRLEVFHGGTRQLIVDRVRGRDGHRIQYRHVIESLVRKPGAFRSYRYFDALFPQRVFRQAFDALSESLPGWQADVHYLRVLKLAAENLESDVADALTQCLAAGQLPIIDTIREKVAPKPPTPPTVTIGSVCLGAYDGLLAATSREVVG